MKRFNLLSLDFSEKALKLLCVLCAAVGFSILLRRALLMIPFRFAFNGIEALNFVVIQNFKIEPLLYHDFSAPPFTMNQYNPLYYWISVWVSHVTGVNYACGRWVTLFSSCGVFFLLFLLMKRYAANASLAFIFASLFAFTGVVSDNWMLMRIDFTALFFETAGIVLALEAERNRSHRFWFLWLGGVLCFILAYFTKQSYVAGAASFLVYLLFCKKWRQVLFFTLIYFGSIFSMTALLNHLTHGVYWLSQQLTIRKPFSWVLFFGFWKLWLEQNWIYLAAASAGIFWAWKDLRQRFFVIYFLTAILSTISLGKLGSGENYFFTVISSGSILACIFFKNILDAQKNSLRRMMIWTALMVPLTAGAFQMQTQFCKIGPKLAELEKSTIKIGTIIRSAKGNVLAENIGFLIAAGQPVFYEPFEFTQMALAGIWDEKQMTDRLDRKEFPLIILSKNLWLFKRTGSFSESFIEHLRAHYRIFAKGYGSIFCVPQ